MLGSSNHVASIHEGLKPLKCESCDYSSSLKHNMKKDVSSFHEGNKSFKCNVCFAGLSLKGNKNKHNQFVKERSSPLLWS